MSETLKQNVASPMDELFNNYESACNEALFRGEDDELSFDFDVARDELVDKGVSIAKTVKDCDRLFSELDPERHSGLWERVEKKRDSIEFGGIIAEFDTQRKAVLEENNSSCEDDEELERVRCNDLRSKYLIRAIEKATNREECLQVLERTHEKNTYIRGLVAEKMALYPVETRKA